MGCTGVKVKPEGKFLAYSVKGLGGEGISLKMMGLADWIAMQAHIKILIKKDDEIITVTVVVDKKTCGPGKYCKGNDVGAHVLFTMPQLSAWARALGAIPGILYGNTLAAQPGPVTTLTIPMQDIYRNVIYPDITSFLGKVIEDTPLRAEALKGLCTSLANQDFYTINEIAEETKEWFRSDPYNLTASNASDLEPFTPVQNDVWDAGIVKKDLEICC
ncbi:hypothetical protein JB92DRAFT_2827416 [Gautieria morchelliformis]|nr:hypothetical protein JB92DRAFT_2827416 [Gautieria morchelliformis]